MLLTLSEFLALDQSQTRLEKTQSWGEFSFTKIKEASVVVMYVSSHFVCITKVMVLRLRYYSSHF